MDAGRAHVDFLDYAKTNSSSIEYESLQATEFADQVWVHVRRGGRRRRAQKERVVLDDLADNLALSGSLQVLSGRGHVLWSCGPVT